jgi:hypothetical protein
MFLEVFFQNLFKPQEWKLSGTATNLLREVASAGEDSAVKIWMDANAGFEISGLAAGYAFRDPEGKIRIGVNRLLLAKPQSLKAQFAAGHELGHLRQLLRGAREAKMYTFRSFAQEVDASEFAINAIKNVNGGLLERRFKSRMYSRVMALEASFPGISHATIATGLFGGAYALSKRLMNR